MRYTTENLETETDMNQLSFRIDNQKIIAKDNLLATRESQVEAVNQEPQIDVIKPDAEKVKAALSMQIDASVAGLAKEGSIQAIYNHYVVGNGDDLADLYTDLSPERTQKVRDFIADALIKTIPKTEDDESPERVIEETRKTEAVKPKGANSSKPKEKAEKEKTSKNILSENLNSSYTSPGSLFPSTSGSRYVKVGNDGKLYKVDEDEDKVSEKPLTLKEARIYLGLPANGILTVNK